MSFGYLPFDKSNHAYDFDVRNKFSTINSISGKIPVFTKEKLTVKKSVKNVDEVYVKITEDEEKSTKCHCFIQLLLLSLVIFLFIAFCVTVIYSIEPIESKPSLSSNQQYLTSGCRNCILRRCVDFC